MKRGENLKLAWQAARDLAKKYGGSASEYMRTPDLVRTASKLMTGEQDLLDVAREYKVVPESFSSYSSAHPSNNVLAVLRDQVAYWMGTKGTWKESSFSSSMITLYAELLSELEAMSQEALDAALFSVISGKTVYESVMQIMDEIVTYYTPEAPSQLEDRLQEVYTMITEADTSKSTVKAREKISEAVATTAGTRKARILTAEDDLSGLFM